MQFPPRAQILSMLIIAHKGAKINMFYYNKEGSPVDLA